MTDESTWRLPAFSLLVAAGVVAAWSWADVAYTAVLFLLTVGVGLLVRARRPRPVGPWVGLTVALGLFAVNNLLYVLGEREVLAAAAAELPGLVLVPVAYLLTVVVSATFVRRRNGGSDRDGLIDALIVGCAAAVVLWQSAVGTVDALDAEQLLTGLMPTVLLSVSLAVLTRLAFAAVDVPAGWFLVAGSALAFATNVVDLVTSTVPDALLFGAWAVSAVLIGGTAAHPSMHQLTRLRETGRPQFVLARLIVLTSALLAPPLAMVARPDDPTVPVIGSCVVTSLAVWRLGRMLRERETRSAIQAVLTNLGRRAVTERLDTLSGAVVNELTAALGLSGAAVAHGEPGSATQFTGTGTLSATSSGELESAASPVGLATIRHEHMVVSYGPPDAPSGQLVLTPAHRAPREVAEAAAAILGAAAQRHRAEELLRHTATHDPLTGLPNRVLVIHSLEIAAKRAQRNHTPYAVLFLDLDGFKAVNDELGHEAGDMVLIATAQRLLATVRGADTVGRLAGDEFVVVADQMDLEAAGILSRRLLAAVSEPIPLPTGVATIGASLGVVLIDLLPSRDADVDSVLRQADAAMYAAKRSGRGRHLIMPWQPAPALTADM